MAIDQTKRAGIEARGDQGRRAGATDNEKALGKDVQDLLAEIDHLAARRIDLEEKVSDLESRLLRVD